MNFHFFVYILCNVGIGWAVHGGGFGQGKEEKI